MPGHVKRGGTGEPDPDPTQFLFITYEEKQKDLAKPYDPKKSCWFPLKEGGYAEGIIESTEGDKVVVKADGEKKVLKKDQVQQVNPPKFERCEDMSNLTYLNEASVLHNLKARYVSKLIYTYSGLFCVAINPYKRFPIYTATAVKIYFGKRRNEVPPHIFAIADGAYQSMSNHGKNQSILVTGESGAGKTENTKKVIGYFAEIAAGSSQAKSDKVSLEDQIVQTNPVLEAFGNAKTVRNDNSSRFGKFIRIHFNQFGKVSGADMEVYLLEKSRITYQQPIERCYHIFYNIMSDQVSTVKKDCGLSNNVRDYHFVSQGKITVDSIDDKEDMGFVDEAFDILGFTKVEKTDVYKLVATVMHLGEMKFKKKSSKDDQAIIETEAVAATIGKLIGIDPDILAENFVQPKIKVGAEWVTKGQNVDQATNSVSGIARALFEKTFRHLVDRCNETLMDATMKRISFIGVLDIAGFEIFDYNGFEQMCINFCNEKLQQFFNHHMFVLEQEEYMREGIEWAMVDFGMDLQNCIDMFERPMGVLSILEEESLFPKATDKTFEDKLKANHLGKSPTFQKPKPGGTDKDAHFAVSHYAGTVNYNLTSWLEKNKDPLNDSVIDLMKNCGNSTLPIVFKDLAGHSVDEDEAPGKKKKGGGKTVSSFYKEQLFQLMTTLHSTEPHFIRCIVPNTHKAAGVIDASLVMHQLTCNGVLEGIRICRKGFPNRMVYRDFQQRYGILNPEGVKAASTSKAGVKVSEEKQQQAMAMVIMATVGLEKEKYRLGHTKVFFRAGVLGMMEEFREERVGRITSWLQSAARGSVARIQYSKLRKQKIALLCVQRAIRNFMVGKLWPWWQLWMGVKPSLRCFHFAEIREQLEAKRNAAEGKISAEKGAKQAAEDLNCQLADEKGELERTLANGSDGMREIESKVKRLETAKKQVEGELSSRNSQVQDTEETNSQLGNSIRKQEQELKRKKDDTELMGLRLQKANDDKVTKDSQIRNLKEELTHQDELVEKLQREKRGAGDGRQKIDEDIQAAEDKSNHLNRIKGKLEQNLDELEDSVERERKVRSETEKLKKKAELDLRITQEAVSELEKNKKEGLTAIQMKEKEMAAIAAKIEDEQSLGSKMQKQVKGLVARLDELETELEGERGNRGKAEKSRHLLGREIEELTGRLEESGNATSAAMDINKKREAELLKLKQELDDANLHHETGLASIRQKHNSIIADLGDQIDQLNKGKAKMEQHKTSLLMDLNSCKHTLEELNMEKAHADKNNKMMQNEVLESANRLEDLYQNLNEGDIVKKRLGVEREDLEKQITEGENQMRNLAKMKSSLANQLEDMKRLAEGEARDKAILVGKFKGLEGELEKLRDRIEEENAAKADIQRALSRNVAEAQIWKSKYSTEALARIEDLENAKCKLVARINEAEECIEGLTLKVQATEKIRNRYAVDLEDLQMEYERITSAIAMAEKKMKNFDLVVGEWKLKCDDIAAELEASQREARNVNSEMFRLKAAWEEGLETLDAVRRENKNLAEEIKDLLDQLGEGGKSIHELDRQRRRLQVEKEELQTALEEAESALEQEENKVVRAGMELQQVRQEIDRRLQEKEEEFEATRKNYQRTIDSLQASLEGEMKGKQEALRVKKKIEADINELEMSLDQANKSNSEDLKQMKRYAGTLMELEGQVAEEARVRADLQNQGGISERKGHALAGELDEAHMLLDAAERSKKGAEMEVSECRENITDLTAANTGLAGDKRHMEGVLKGAQGELEGLAMAVKNSEEKSKKAVADASRLAEELRTEHEHGLTAERNARASFAQCNELQVRLEEAEATAASYGRKMIAKLEEKVRMLEEELGSCQLRGSETHKAAVRADRGIKELQFTSEEEQKNFEKLSELVEKLQGKTRTYKKQIEDAEEIAALNLAKFRKAQQQLEEAEDRSQNAENHMGRMRAGSQPRFDRNGFNGF